MSPAHSSPEAYFIRHSTPHVPNSTLPVLVYRSALNDNLTPDATCDLIEPNNWIKGGVFKHYAAYPSIVLHMSATQSSKAEDLEIDLEAGDAIVLPAGVSHCSLTSSDDYEYVGLYPKGSPHWDNNFCKASEEETREKAANAQNVPMPDYDPVFGLERPLVKI